MPFKPIRREKKGIAFRCRLPNEKRSTSWRKKALFSGKNGENRLRLTYRSSTSVAEKSVFSVRTPVNEGVKL